jgi:protein-S-isoprenylcysteine O-methyltransferase Ste14
MIGSVSRFVLLRHLVAIVILPVSVAVLVPSWIAQRYHIVLHAGISTPAVLVQLTGAAVALVGLFLFIASLWRFATDGRGTLAPWDPPRLLVVNGPYQYVRNPMISGVLFVVTGEALILLSVAHALWAAFFLSVNLIYIRFVEEPQLARRFGPGYDIYRESVPRFIPRLRPWQPRFRAKR